MSKSSGSALFLLEQLLVIVIFSVCAAACVKILVNAYLTAGLAEDISNGLLAAERGAECLRAWGGDALLIGEALGGERQQEGGVIVHYGPSWQVCGGAEAAYVLRISLREAGAMVVVEKIGGGELVSLTVAEGSGYE